VLIGSSSDTMADKFPPPPMKVTKVSSREELFEGRRQLVCKTDLELVWCGRSASAYYADVKPNTISLVYITTGGDGRSPGAVCVARLLRPSPDPAERVQVR
jgi:hypothetical protein